MISTLKIFFSCSATMQRQVLQGEIQHHHWSPRETGQWLSAAARCCSEGQRREWSHQASLRVEGHGGRLHLWNTGEAAENVVGKGSLRLRVHAATYKGKGSLRLGVHTVLQCCMAVVFPFLTKSWIWTSHTHTLVNAVVLCELSLRPWAGSNDSGSCEHHQCCLWCVCDGVGGSSDSQRHWRRQIHFIQTSGHLTEVVEAILTP